MCRIVPYEIGYLDGVIAMVKAVHVEYAFTWEADGYHSDLYDVEGHYIDPGGMFWVVLDGARVVGCAGVTLHGDHCELHRMYLAADCRGRGLGRRLLDVTMEFGRSKGCERMVAWSDVKLTLAHRLYRRSGFVQEGERICDDPDSAREYGFWKSPI